MSTLSAFKPPASCLATTYTLAPSGSDIMRAYPGIILSRSANTACFPPGYLSTSYFTITPLGYEDSPSGSSTSCIYTTRGSDFALSPARCPSGYITVATATATPGQTYEYGHTTRTATVTSATCCPSEFTWNGISDCTAAGRTDVTYLEGSLTTTAYALEEFATPVIVAFEAAKAVQTSSSSGGGSSLAQSPIPAGASGVVESTSTPQEQPSGKPLSNGAKASIGAAVTIGLVVIVATLVFVLRRRAKRRFAVDAEAKESYTKAELPAESKQNAELDSHGALHEAGGLHKPAEAENSSRAELEGDWTGWEAPVLADINLSQVEVPSDAIAQQSESPVQGRQPPRV